jgi:hypothetical protein
MSTGASAALTARKYAMREAGAKLSTAVNEWPVEVLLRVWDYTRGMADQVFRSHGHAMTPARSAVHERQTTPPLFKSCPRLKKRAKVAATSRTKRQISMTTNKLLSTGLIAIAMLTTPAAARDNIAAGRRVIIRGAPHYISISAPAGRWIIWNGIPIWFGPSVRGVPGHICDDGDNERIC